MRARIIRIAIAVLGLLVPGTVLAQVANPLPQALGMADSYTAMARGLASPAWNPAGLGMPDNPGFSITVIPIGFTAGIGPIGPSDFADYDGRFIPETVRSDWLQRIRDEGGEKGTIGADVTYLAFNVGQFAFSASSSAHGRVNMAPDVAEILFFGNAGLTGQPADLSLEGSNLDVAGTTTFAGSFAIPLSLTLGPLPDQHFAIGATIKYTIGNFLVLGQESRSTLSSDPLAVDLRFPTVHTPDPESTGDVFDNGSGFGLDIGAAWQGGIFSAGVSVKNVIHTFEWDLDKLRFSAGTALWDADTTYTDFVEGDIGDAPAELIDRIETLFAFSPVLAAGASARVMPTLEVAGEVRHALDDNLDVGTQTHVGVGAELTVLPVLPIRAGLAAISGGYQLSGGLGLRLGGFELALSGAARETDLGSDARAAFGFTVGVP